MLRPRWRSQPLTRYWSIGLCFAVSIVVGGVGCSSDSEQIEEPRFQATSPDYERRDQPAADVDAQILIRATEILINEQVWDRHDDRVCDDEDTTWSLFCALKRASNELTGVYEHRRVALQEVRFAIEEASEGEEFAHRLRDFNNTRSFEEVKQVLAVALARVETRLEQATPGSS